jgi:hypothetical protein
MSLAVLQQCLGYDQILRTRHCYETILESHYLFSSGKAFFAFHWSTRTTVMFPIFVCVSILLIGTSLSHIPHSPFGNRIAESSFHREMEILHCILCKYLQNLSWIGFRYIFCFKHSLQYETPSRSRVQPSTKHSSCIAFASTQDLQFLEPVFRYFSSPHPQLPASFK